MTQSMITNDPVYNKKTKEILQQDEEAITNFVIAIRSEVHFTGKENIEGFASLVNLFMRSMYVSCSNPAIINIDNIEDNIDKLKLDDGQLFYYSTIEFKDSFTSLLSKKISSLSTINVKTNFKKMLVEQGQINVAAANKLCTPTFKYLGLKDTIYV